MHSNGLVHRDIKPENFLFESDDPGAELKLIDFGLSSKHHPTQSLHSIVGSPYYVSPEVLKADYGPECDIWSAGVIMYVLLSGCFPFGGETN
jgi:calcium-dependent protein kinase